MLAHQPNGPAFVCSLYLLAIAPSFPQRKVCTKPGTIQTYPGAAASLREGLEEMFTVARLGIDGRLAKTLTTSNPIESMISIARATNCNVTRWRDGQMVLRWTAAGMLNAERSFRRIRGRKQMPQLVEALHRPPTAKRTQPLNPPVPPPRVHHESSPKFPATATRENAREKSRRGASKEGTQGPRRNPHWETGWRCS